MKALYRLSAVPELPSADRAVADATFQGVDNSEAHAPPRVQEAKSQTSASVKDFAYNFSPGIGRW
jgi:hypothetical protein